MPLIPEYLRILDRARSARKENKKFLERLRKNRPADLDKVTHEFHEKAFEKIDCLKCANCCATTGPLLKNRDIEALAKARKITASAFTEHYVRTDEDGDQVFKESPCPFLRNDHHCSVYEARPQACREYPHTQQRDIAGKMQITFLNSMICPAVALIVDDLRNHYGDR